MIASLRKIIGKRHHLRRDALLLLHKKSKIRYMYMYIHVYMIVPHPGIRVSGEKGHLFSWIWVASSRDSGRKGY